MDVNDIIGIFEQSARKFPREAIQEAIRQKDQIIPELLALIESPTDLLRKLERQPSYMGHIYAFFLLAQFRITQTLPLILDIYAHPSEQVTPPGDDFVTGDLARIVASVYNGDPTPLKRLIENPGINEYVRDAMLRALMILVIHQKMPREELADYCTLLIREKLERTPSAVWDGITQICADLAERRVLEDIKATYAENLVESFFIEIEDMEESMASGWARNQEHLAANPDYQLVEDVIGEMEWWAYFKEPSQQKNRPRSSKPAIIPRSQGRTPHRSNQKVNHKRGRNNPCPCGSGKKYKNCCGKRGRSLRSSS